MMACMMRLEGVEINKKKTSMALPGLTTLEDVKVE